MERVQPGESPTERLPVEIIRQIMGSMASSDLLNFALSSRKLFTVFRENKASILSKVLLQTPELEILLYLFTVDKLDFEPGHMLQPRIIKFDPQWESGTFITLLDNTPVAGENGDLIPPIEKTLTISDIHELLKMVAVVDWWADFFPSQRWAESPEERRCLRPWEEARLRRAIARWWLFAWHCHGILSRNFLYPHKWADDKRLHQIRIMSTREICELEDFWGVLYDTVSRELCSSPERVKVGVCGLNLYYDYYIMLTEL